MKIDKKLRKSIAERMLRWILDGYGYTIRNIEDYKDNNVNKLMFEFEFDDPKLNTRYSLADYSAVVLFRFYVNRDDIAVDILTFMNEEIYEHIHHKVSTLTRMFFTKRGMTMYKLAEELMLELDLMGI